MKLSAMLILTAAAVAHAQLMCKISFDPVISWDESGRRYRTKAEFLDTHNMTGDDSKKMLDDFCKTYIDVAKGYKFNTINPQCWTESNTKAFADTSVAHGPAGQDALWEIYMEVILIMSTGSHQGCRYENHSVPGKKTPCLADASGRTDVDRCPRD